ncbi:MAG TPA: hypothetical protein VGM58_10830 [Verrucomicrobiae bacterium]
MKTNMRVALFIVLAMFVNGCAQSSSDTTVDLWISYTSAPSSEKNYDFELRNFKREFILGICPSTKQLQWSYQFDLAGERPTYNLDQLRVDDSVAGDAQLTKVYLKVTSGHVMMDRIGHTVTIDIQIQKDGITNDFIGNGTYPFHE